MADITAEDLVAQGIEFMAEGRFAEGKAAFEKALALDNKSYEAYLNLGNACVNLEQYEDGIAAFKKALIARPDDTSALYSLGCAYFLAGNNVEALRYLNKCESLGFVSTEMYGIMELMFLDEGDNVQAIRCVNKAIKLDPLNPQFYVDKAQLYVLDDKPKEAIAALREVEELLPDAGEPYLVEIQIYEQTEELDRALEVADRAIGRFPDDAGLYLAKARVLVAQENYIAADAALDAAGERAAGNTALLRQLAMQQSVVQLGLKDVDGSIATLERLVLANGQDAEALFLLASECFGAHEYEKSKKYSDALLQIPDVEPRFKAAGVFWGASSLKELGRKDEAHAAFEDALSTLRQITIANPGLMEVYIYRGMCNKELGNFDDAHALVDHVIALSPETAAGYSFKADIYKAQGDLDNMRAMREKTLSLDPDFKFEEGE